MENYSLWLKLPHSVEQILQSLCDQLAVQHNGPTFEAHITLTTGITGNEKLIQEQISEILKDTDPLSLSTLDVACSVTYFQAVFLRISPTAELLDLNLKIRKAFSLEPELFMPHVSLFYGKDEMSERLEIAQQIEIDPTEFVVDTLVLTPAVPDPKKWEHLAEYKLS
jgi:2'-5' RNA ligase